MIDQHVVLEVTPFAELLLANGAKVTMLVLPMVLHVQETVALKVAYFALELNDARVDALVGSHLKKV
jgi:hypothetical protein